MSNQSADLQAAARLITGADRILVFHHVSPDGDAIGSTLGLVRALRRAGKDAVGVLVDPIPRLYQFLPGWDELLVPWQEIGGEWDLAVILDCGDLERVGASLPVVKKAKTTLNIDHHSTNNGFGDHHYLDFKAAAVGEMIYRLLREAGIAIDTETATCLYTALVTDTGSFRYDSTAPSTHRAAADLIEEGARPYDVASAVYENESIARTNLAAQVLATLQVDPGGKIAWLHVTREMLDRCGARDEDADGLVNHARSIMGIEVGILFKETPDGFIRVGLRSRYTVDVGGIAKQFGGGGHARASGCGLAVPMQEAQERILAAVRAAM